MQAQRKTIIGCALLFLTIAGTCWWVWDTQLARHPNQLFGQLRQQGPDEKGVAKPPRRLATRLPGEQTKRWQAAKFRNAHGKHLFASDAGRSGLDHLPHEGQLSGGPVPSRCAKTREREGHCRRLPQSAGDHVPCLAGEETLHGTRSLTTLTSSIPLALSVIMFADSNSSATRSRLPRPMQLERAGDFRRTGLLYFAANWPVPSRRALEYV